MMKYDRIYGAVVCIQASLFQVFSLYVLIPEFPLIIKAISSKRSSPFYYINESDGGMFVFIMWLLILVTALIFESIGLSKIKNSFRHETAGKPENGSAKYTKASGGVSGGEAYSWTCPKCGKVNRSTCDVDACSCGYSPMD